MKEARDEMFQLMPPEVIQQLEQLGLWETFVRMNAWMRAAEKVLDRHEERICQQEQGVVAAIDRLTQAVSSLESTIQKAIEDGKRPMMRPPGGL